MRNFAKTSVKSARSFSKEIDHVTSCIKYLEAYISVECRTRIVMLLFKEEFYAMRSEKGKERAVHGKYR